MDFPVAMADDYFKRSELDEKRADTLNVRVPKSLKTQLEELAQFLTDKDRVANKEARGTSVGDVVVRLLKAGVEGADARVAAAEHLKTELTNILAGEPPYDLFVRWKPLAEQPIGWEPDINDGVRINIRPFMTAKPFGARAKGACILRVTPKIKWDKDRGKEPQRAREDFPWFWGWDPDNKDDQKDFGGRGKEPDGNRWNDLHYTRAFKQAARDKRSKSN